MSVSWSFFVSKRVRKGDVDLWLKNKHIYDMNSLLEYLSKIKVRPPTEKESGSINWPTRESGELVENKKQNLKPVSLGQKSLSDAIETSKNKLASKPKRKVSQKPKVQKPSQEKKKTTRRSRKNKDE